MRFVLDTNAILYQLGDRLADPLPRGEPYASVITELELLSYPSLDREGEQRVEQSLAEIAVVGITQAVKREAIRLRWAHGMKLPDAIVAATALILDAELFTNDARLARTPGIRCRSVRLKP